MLEVWFLKLCIAVALLVIYLFLMFLITESVGIVKDLYSISSSEIRNTSVFSAEQLKQILNARGMSYVGLLEKEELVNLVDQSGVIVQSELEELQEPMPEQRSFIFKGIDDFDKTVGHTEEHIWLTLILPFTRLSSYPHNWIKDEWIGLKKMVQTYGIRTGIYNCSRSYNFCMNKNWIHPKLLLAKPSLTQRGKVVIETHSLSSSHVILQWIREHLSFGVEKISNVEDLKNDWLTPNRVILNSEFMYIYPKVKVFLLSRLLEPPLFFKAVSFKFKDRISFGFYTVKENENLMEFEKVPSYLIIFGNKLIEYGRKNKEHYNFRSFYEYLAALDPKLNVYLWRYAVLFNMVAILFIFQMIRVDSVETIVWSFIGCWIANILYFLTWLILQNTSNLFLSDWFVYMVRKFVLSNNSKFRSFWTQLLNKPYWFCSSFLLFIIILSNIDLIISVIALFRKGFRLLWYVLIQISRRERIENY